MAEINWTKEQEKAIVSSGGNILVSAAAGSGKTAVLVERVIRMLTRHEDPVDIDELLIMTFTNPAAAQLKEKIYIAIKKALVEDPDNAHLHRQLLKVGSAHISTIDSLCLSIVRENFQDIDIDPAFRIADTAEAQMLKEDVLKELLEAHHMEPTPGFLEFVEFYTNKNDSKTEDIIQTLYRFAVSHPEPEEWLRACVAPYLANADPSEIDPWAIEVLGISHAETGNDWTKVFRDNLIRNLKGLLSDARKAYDISQMNYGPEKYAEVAQDAEYTIRTIIEADGDFATAREYLILFKEKWSAFPKITKKDSVDPALKDRANALLTRIRNAFYKLQESFFAHSYEENLQIMGKCANTAAAIAALTIEFLRKFGETKAERKIAEFSDIARYALHILIQTDENGRLMTGEDGYLYTPVADSMAQSLKEIIIDEYQDTNQLQECIADALSARRFCRPDVFMVGDVKQSIYGFRMACPELFNEKYNTYDDTPEKGYRIILDANFRSRREILDLTNYVFEQVMIPEVGGIDYTDGNRLSFGAERTYKDPEEPDSFIPEVLFIKGDGDLSRKAESYQIALKIEELVGCQPVTEGPDGAMRAARYSDICILTRTTDHTELDQMLESRGIPFVTSASKGFLSSLEIRLILNVLDIIDNPLQNIPFTAVLTSPLVSLSANDLAQIKMSYGQSPYYMYDACLKYLEDNEQPVLAAFMQKLQDYRARSFYMSVTDLLEYVLDDSGLYDIFVAMPQGESRRANADMLLAIAAEYAAGSYSGLFNFLRYVRMMVKSDIDFGQATVAGAAADAVRIMTMHKSKGLEFPIVFIAACGKGYNDKDISNAIVMDRELGLGIEFRDPVERIKETTMLMETIRMQKRKQLTAEELRLLYVAMTRAKEKLIMSGAGKFSKEFTSQLQELAADEHMQMAENLITGAKSNFKMLALSLIRHRDGEALGNAVGADINPSAELCEGNCSFSCTVMPSEEAYEDRAVEIMDMVRLDAKLKDELLNIVSHEDEAKMGLFDRKYPFEWAVITPVKLTASQLEQRPDDSDVKYSYKTRRNSEALFSPDDEETEEISRLYGASRGTAYHTFFELLDLIDFLAADSDSKKLEIIALQTERMKSKGYLSQQEAVTIDPELILKFVNSTTGQMMIRAEEEGRLHREQQFVMGYPENGEERLLQGIIDAYILEDNAIILIDYKTDRTLTHEEFIVTYKAQQDAYKNALEAAYSLPVTAQLLYLVETGESIELLQ